MKLLSRPNRDSFNPEKIYRAAVAVAAAGAIARHQHPAIGLQRHCGGVTVADQAGGNLAGAAQGGVQRAGLTGGGLSTEADGEHQQATDAEDTGLHWVHRGLLVSMVSLGRCSRVVMAIRPRKQPIVSRQRQPGRVASGRPVLSSSPATRRNQLMSFSAIAYGLRAHIV